MLCFLCFSVLAEDVSLPYIFEENTPAKAAEVNANFEALKHAIDEPTVVFDSTGTAVGEVLYAGTGTGWSGGWSDSIGVLVAGELLGAELDPVGQVEIAGWYNNGFIAVYLDDQCSEMAIASGVTKDRLWASLSTQALSKSLVAAAALPADFIPGLSAQLDPEINDSETLVARRLEEYAYLLELTSSGYVPASLWRFFTLGEATEFSEEYYYRLLVTGFSEPDFTDPLNPTTVFGYRVSCEIGLPTLYWPHTYVAIPFGTWDEWVAEFPGPYKASKASSPP